MFHRVQCRAPVVSDICLWHLPVCRKSKLQCICGWYNPLLFWNWCWWSEFQSSQLALNSVENWYPSNLLSLSKEMSVTLLVRGNKRNEPGDLNVTLGGHPLKQERHMKYLGIYLDQNLSSNEQCDRLRVHIAGKLAVLRRIRNFVKPDLLKLLFEKTIQPVFVLQLQCHSYLQHIVRHFF